MPACPPSDCSWLLGNKTARPPALVPNPDISGIGVLVGFVGTAYLTLFLLLANYLFVYVPDELDESTHINSLDQAFVGWVRRKFRVTSRSSEWQTRWEKTLKNCILSLSDQQIVTGIAILASGYSQLTCGLPSYHWQIVVYLAWFSSLTHLTTLTVLRPYLHRYHLLLLLRLLFMAAVLVLLGCALLPTGNSRWLDRSGILDYSVVNTNSTLVHDSFQPGIPAQCFYQQLSAHEGYSSGSSQFLSMIVSLFVLTSSYLIKVVKLSRKGSLVSRQYIRSKPGAWWKGRLHRQAILHSRASTRANRVKLSFHPIEVTVFVIVLAIFDLVESTLWEIIWLVYALMWGTVHLVSARDPGSNSSTNDSNGINVGKEENFWGFGQWVAALLLLLPLLTLVEACYETMNDLRSKKALENIVSMDCRSPRLFPSSVQRSFSRSRLSGLVRSSSSPGNQTDDEFPLHTIARSGSDIAHEEQSVGLQERVSTRRQSPVVAQERHPTQPTLQPLDLQDAAMASNPCLFLEGTFHSYPWFRDLIIILLVLVSELTVYVLVESYLAAENMLEQIPPALIKGLFIPIVIFSIVLWCILFEGDVQPNHQLVQGNRCFCKTKVPIPVIIWFPRVLGAALCCGSAVRLSNLFLI